MSTIKITEYNGYPCFTPRSILKACDNKVFLKQTRVLLILTLKCIWNTSHIGEKKYLKYQSVTLKDAIYLKF